MTATKKAAAKKVEEPKVKQIAFRVDPELARRLKIASAVHGKTQLTIVQEAVESHLTALEKKGRK